MRKRMLAGLFAVSVLLSSCGESASLPAAKKSEQESQKSAEIAHEKDESEILFSNMSDEASRKEVGDALKRYLNAENVDRFIETVKDYNDTVENTSLQGAFKAMGSPEYDEAKMMDLWSEKKGDFIGTNCRLNVFMLMKDNIKLAKKEADSELLFMDKDAIQTGKLFGEEETQRFQELFSRVKTEDTKDFEVHAKKMQDYFSDFIFDEDVRMISVVIHDHMDGDYLFIGHVAVLTEVDGRFLLIEKLSFSEPYQALKFSSKEDCYRYLYQKYEHYSDESTAKPFIMDNGEAIDSAVFAPGHGA